MHLAIQQRKRACTAAVFVFKAIIFVFQVLAEQYE